MAPSNAHWSGRRCSSRDHDQQLSRQGQDSQATLRLRTSGCSPDAPSVRSSRRPIRRRDVSRTTVSGTSGTSGREAGERSMTSVAVAAPAIAAIMIATPRDSSTDHPRSASPSIKAVRYPSDTRLTMGPDVAPQWSGCPWRPKRWQQHCLRLTIGVAAGRLPPDCERQQQDTHGGECDGHARWPDSLLLIPLMPTTCRGRQYPEDIAHNGAAGG